MKKMMNMVLLIALYFAVYGIPSSTVNARDLKQGDWSGHGFTQGQKNDLESFMQGAIENGDIAGGTLALVHQGEVIFRGAFGYADLETRRSFTMEAVYYMASVSKPVTATLMVILEDRGILSLDDPVEKWIPAFRGIEVKGQDQPAPPPLLWQALSHRSGLPGVADRGEEFGRYYGALSDVVDSLAGDGLAADPGTRYSYGQAGYKTAGRAAELATGKSFETLLDELLLKPLGMGHTTFYPSEEMLENRPEGYVRKEKGFDPLPGDFVLRFIKWGVDPGGGIFSTLDDMTRFVLLHLNRGVVNGKRLVSPEALDRIYLVPDNPPEPSYGLGWHVIRHDGLQIQHSGGSGTMVWIDFGRNMAGVFLTQTRWQGNRAFQRRFTETMQEIFGKR